MRITRWAVVLCFLLCFEGLSAFADWPPLSPDDLSMTSVKEQPGAPALILLREETDDDMNNMHQVYERIKILSDAGREYANVEIPYSRRGFSIGGISGRTVHADGSVVPFEGKPFDKTVVKGGGIRINVKSFTLPGVQVGSIIDFRYSLRYDDHRLLPPEWEVQNDLFQRKAYFKFIPFQNHGSMYVQLDHGQVANGIAWEPLLGIAKQPEVHHNAAAEASFASSAGQPTMWIDLNLENIPAFVEEPYAPPASMIKWRVYFYYQEKLTPDDYWKAQGKYWNKDVEGFLGSNRGIDDAVRGIVTASDSPEQKVRKIYSFVAKLENQDYIPERTKQEEKVLELKINKGADDVLAHHSGTHDELNRLFVAMVRAAGIPASLIWVPDRSREVFLKPYLSTRQFDAEIAIVQLGGKDVFLDPGTKFCPYGILDWHYSGVEGLRQSPKGAEVGQTSIPEYRQSITTRMASVALDEHGVATGTVALVFKGATAMRLRQEGGKTDDAGRKKLLEDGLSDSDGRKIMRGLRDILPGNSDITLTSKPDWENPDSPLVAEFHISCPLAVAAGKRLMLAQHLFQVNEKPLFPASNRTNAVYFHLPWQEADEVHIRLPAGMTVDSLAPDDTVKLPYALYVVKQKEESPGQIFSRRDFIMAQGVFLANEYKPLKDFFDKVKADDDQTALVKAGSNVATTN
ncbi:MAG TPA: DUF3857 domain-containing protein [Terriglobales bacterium]